MASTQLPVIFLACVNSYENGKRMRFLVNERKEIARIIESGKKPAVYSPVQKGNIANEYFYDLLTKYNYQDRVEILHLTGLADEDHLRLESNAFEVPIHLEELSKTIGMLPNLKVVFLSGCATPGLLEMLLKRDIPAVIVTETREKDAQTTEIAREFYESIANGHSIQRAFSIIKKKFHRIKIHKVRYDLEKDEFTWRGKKTFEKRDIMDWGLYYLEDNLLRINQRSGNQSIITLPAATTYVKSRQLRKRIRFLSLTAAAITLALLAAGAKLYFDSLEQLHMVSSF